jgi:hypothetical protein
MSKTEAQITLTPTPGITPEQARDAHARAWGFVFRCWQEKQMAARHTPTPDGHNERNRFVNKERGCHDLTNDMATDSSQAEGVSRDKKGTEK